MSNHSKQAMVAAEKVLIEYLKHQKTDWDNLSFTPICDSIAAIIDEEHAELRAVLDKCFKIVGKVEGLPTNPMQTIKFDFNEWFEITKAIKYALEGGE